MGLAALYVRVSTDQQTTENQERELRDIPARMGCAIVEVYRDHGISGAKGRDKRPAFDALCKDAARRRFDISHETQLLADGVHPKIAQERLGHSTITTTMDLYSHVTDTMQADAAARLDAAFRSAINGRVAK